MKKTRNQHRAIDNTKSELEQLQHMVTNLVTKDPEKAARILGTWIKQPARNVKKKAA